jgi:diguanylate cyclase (GGDEF)-like protein
MNGVVFFLTVNFIVAICFSAVFCVVSTRSRSRTAALWFAAGFGIASLSAICELLIAYTSLPEPWAFGAFATVFVGMLLLRIGVGEMYDARLRWWIGIPFLLASLFLSYATYGLPRSTPAHAFSYQAPFSIAVFMSAWAVMRSRRALVVDRFLGILLLVTGLHFLAKAGLAVVVGSGTVAKDYIHTNYALISQSMTAILMVAVGLTLLAVLVLEIMADQQSESEKDALSGLCNRRGFQRAVQAALARNSQTSHCVILCDLDHFKSINDRYGHHVGDRVIQSFGEILRSSIPQDAVAGRVGGEEFALFLPATEIETAILFAQALRNTATTITIPGAAALASVTASFGVASLSPGSSFDEALRHADMALYEAKDAGRNRVKAAPHSARRDVQFKPTI